MEVGTILSYDNEMGQGMIADHQGKELYFHYTAIADPALRRSLMGGVPVIYNLWTTKWGQEAANVMVKRQTEKPS